MTKKFIKVPYKSNKLPNIPNNKIYFILEKNYFFFKEKPAEKIIGGRTNSKKKWLSKCIVLFKKFLRIHERIHPKIIDIPDSCKNLNN